MPFNSFPIKFADVSIFRFIWDQTKCTLRYDTENKIHFYVKKLSKLKSKGYDLKRTLIVDDTPSKAILNYVNVIYPNPYSGEANDDELLHLADYLISLIDCSD